MAIRATSLIVLAGLSGTVFACSSSDGNAAKGKVKVDTTASGEVCDANDPKIPCVKGVSEPCDDFHTDYKGDELCMKPPTKGYQLHVGPTDYTDPDQVNPWILPPGGLPGQG